MAYSQHLTKLEQASALAEDGVHDKQTQRTIVNNMPPVEIISDQMWSLQLASFTIKAGADVRNQVQTLGYEAKSEKAETAKGDIFRGRIGLTQDKLMLEAARQLHQKLKLQPQIFKQIP